MPSTSLLDNPVSRLKPFGPTEACVLFARQDMEVLAVEVVPRKPREIARRVIAWDATRLVVAIVGGDGGVREAAPEARVLAEAMSALETRVMDIILVGPDGVESFRGLGLL